MKRTRIPFDVETVPYGIGRYLGTTAEFYDSSCSEKARTLLVEGASRAYLKISGKGTLEREHGMTAFLSRYRLAPKAIAYESDAVHDYLLTEAVPGEDGVSGVHLQDPGKLAAVFGECLRMLHATPIESCPYRDRTIEMLDEHRGNGLNINAINRLRHLAKDNVIIHGDYCLPNIIMDNFSFKAFIDVGSGGVGDRHYDLYWGVWTLRYNLKTDRYKDVFLDAYGRDVVDPEVLMLFTEFMEAAG